MKDKYIPNAPVTQADDRQPVKKRSTHLPPVHTRFKKGVSGNPSGGRAHNPIRRALKNLTVETYRQVIELVCTGNLAELELMTKDPKISALQVGVATAFLKALKAGDYGTIERIAERIVGKIPDELNVNSRNLNANLNASVSDSKVKAALAKLEESI